MEFDNETPAPGDHVQHAVVRSKRGIIVAISPEWVIGLDGKIPWRYPGDLRRFKRITMGSTIIMGRKTWESLGSKPLPGRRNVVITSRVLSDVETYRTIEAAITAMPDDPVWFIGGAGIYEEALRYADIIDVTFVRDSIVDPKAVKFPTLDPHVWQLGPLVQHEDEPRLLRGSYTTLDYRVHHMGEKVTMAEATHANLGQKADHGKLQWHLVPLNAMREIVRVLNHGATKYSPGNWRHVENARDRYYSAMLRHVTTWYDGEKNDPEWGLHHLAHACCCGLFLLALDLKGELK